MKLVVPTIVLIFAAVAGCAAPVGLVAADPADEARPASDGGGRRVLVISVDGLRPDLLLRAPAPNMRSMLRDGSFTFWALTTKESYTLPSHVSMLTGVIPDRHGVTWNDHIEEAYPNVPTLFTLAKQHGYTTALAVGKTKFVALTPPQSLDWKFQPMDEPIPDHRVADETIEILREHRPGVMFVHFAGVDNVGHARGWGSPEHIAAIAEADAALGKVLDALDDLNLRRRTLIILTSDHGGAGREHRPGDPRSRHVPWIATGPGVRKNFDLTGYLKLTVRTEDTFATACAFLKIPLPRGINGKRIKQIYQPRELLGPIQ